MKVINKDQLVDMLEGKTKHIFISIEAETMPVKNKTGRETKETTIQAFNYEPKEIKKITYANVGLCYDYKSLIINRLKKEGKEESEYVAGDTWHEHCIGTKNLRQHKQTGEKYVWVFFIANNTPKTCFYNSLTGSEINKALLEQFLPKDYEPTNQGLETDNIVHPRLYKLDSIKKIKIDSEEYIVK